MKHEYFKPKSPKFMKELVASSKDFPDNTYILQFLEQTREAAEGILNQCDEFIDEFEKAGGQFKNEENSTVFSLKESKLVIYYNEDEDGDSYDMINIPFASQKAKLIVNAAIAVYVKPKYDAVQLVGIPTLQAYIENSDSVEGLRKLQDILTSDAGLAASIMQGAVAKEDR